MRLSKTHYRKFNLPDLQSIYRALTTVVFALFLQVGLAMLACAKEPTEKLGPSDGFQIHDYQFQVMAGFPPAQDKVVTLDNQAESREHLRWALQHARELSPTQNISRGNNRAYQFPRSPIAVSDFNLLKFTGRDDKEISIRDYLRQQSVDAIIVLKDGRIVNEQYFNGMEPQTPHVMYSMGKSLTATMLADVLKDQLRENQTVETYVPMFEDSILSGATLRDLFDMKSGIDFSYRPDTKYGFAPYAETTRGLAKDQDPQSQWDYLLTLKNPRSHGQVMRYKEIDVEALTLVAEKSTGKRFADLFSETIWSRLGAEHDAQVQCDSYGQAVPSFGISATLRDVGRWGQMCLQRGQFNGSQIVPRHFFDDLDEKGHTLLIDPTKYIDYDNAGVPEGTGYRSFFWFPGGQSDAMLASGGLGQICYINRRYQTVIVVYSSWTFDDDHRQLTSSQWHGCEQISRLVSQ